jgi:hypothetical protein
MCRLRAYAKLAMMVAWGHADKDFPRTIARAVRRSVILRESFRRFRNGLIFEPDGAAPFTGDHDIEVGIIV